MWPIKKLERIQLKNEFILRNIWRDFSRFFGEIIWKKCSNQAMLVILKEKRKKSIFFHSSLSFKKKA